MMEILIPIIVLGGLGLVLGVFLAYASKKFAVEIDENVEKVIEILPGINCGACGYPGCNGYADGVVLHSADINLCAPGGAEVVSNIAKILGQEVKEGGEKIVARVMCKGDNSKSTKRYDFNVDNKSCAASSIYFGGDKSCVYGCLGYGDCADVCPVDAIEITDKGIAIVDEDKCVSCGKCVKACPKYVIKMVPQKSEYTVFCSSKDKGALSRKVCEVSCIACTLCVKACPVDAIEITGNLAKIDPEKCINCGLCELKCPTNAIQSDIKEKKLAVIDEEKCIGCTICKKVCPVDAIEGEVKQKHKIIKDKCVGCGLCEEKCPVKAIEMEVTAVKK